MEPSCPQITNTDSTVLWDTGSTDLLLPRSNCTTCGGHALFNPSSSSTFSPEPNLPAELFFGTGGDSVPLPDIESVSGTVVADVVSAGGLTAYTQSFLLADAYGPALNYQPIDGIMGLGPANASGLGEITGISTLLPFYWNLYQAGALASPVFSWFIRPGHEHGAELTLGGINPARHQEEIQYIDLEKELSAGRGKWVMEQSTTIYVDGAPVQVGRRDSRPPDLAVLDTGTPFVLTPDFTAARDLYAAISPAISLIDPLGAWGAPCDELDDAAADVTFTFGPPGGVRGNFTVFKRFFNLGPYPGLDGVCQAAFSSPGEDEGEVANQDTGQRVWAVGSPLLKAYYTVWDGIDLRVGFARPRCGGG